MVKKGGGGLGWVGGVKKKIFLHERIELKKCLTHPSFPESDKLHSAACFVFWLIRCRSKRTPLCWQYSSFQLVQRWQPYNAPLCLFSMSWKAARGGQGGVGGPVTFSELTRRTFKGLDGLLFLARPFFFFCPPAVKIVTFWKELQTLC